MYRLTVPCFFLGLMTLTAQATETADSAFIAFQQALGEPSLIASGSSDPKANTAFRPIPENLAISTDMAKRRLGFDLFHDTRLSSDNSVSCSSCHMGMHGGTDNLSLSRGIGGRLGSMNAPTVFNAVFNFRQFWDGRALDLDEQALGPLSNPVEMGHDLQAVVDFVASDADYVQQFDALYPDGVSAANIGNAIAQHTKDMTRTDSRFNAFLGGDSAALSDQEKRGWERFQAVGCASCHNGINLGGNSYQRLSNSTAVSDFFDRRAPRPADAGLIARSGREQDRYVFKVPTLNNIALTAPYYHDGSVPTLKQAVRLMGASQAGRELSEPDVEDIVAFLHSLSSEFFASRSHGMMNHEAMQGEMRRQMQMDGQGQQRGGMPHGQHHRMGSGPMGAGRGAGAANHQGGAGQ